ncbi:GNAT family N-acetyltransferase [Aequorivita echinoideorum]|uniref:N-acetyltransferase n=1 Tax=Aequorivita echinoideorum TaxID=1549647 RepID=A0ABS5S7A7_9FLAO|nr:GNAT family N-acetyltransferase [Aequorivita echinoideorum]MBT0609098.1 N-acetyltransferase [Aequorivita echinoideorum]
MELIDNKQKNRFEYKIEDNNAIVEYKIDNNVISLTHTEVPDELQGQGIASKMTEEVLQNLSDKNLKVKPLCPFIKSYIKRNPEWKEIVADGY